MVKVEALDPLLVVFIKMNRYVLLPSQRSEKVRVPDRVGTENSPTV